MKTEIEFNRSEDSYNLLRGLGSQCINEREECFKSVLRNIDSWFLGFGSPGTNLENSMESTNSTNDNSLHYLIEQLIPDILRLSITSPYEDVRDQCHHLLISLQRKSFKIPTPKMIGFSNFVPTANLQNLILSVQENQESDFLQNLLWEHYEDWGRLENYIMLIGYHPRYLEQYMKVYNHLFRGDGSLPYVDRYYVAIMAASQMHNRELIYRFVTEFLSSGGDPIWLRGLNEAPQRLQAISILCQYLCHQPWEIEPKNISQLIHGPSGSFHISLSQLMHAVVIMTHVASLATFLSSCGVNHELDHPDAHLVNGYNYSRNANYNYNLYYNDHVGDSSDNVENDTDSSLIVTRHHHRYHQSYSFSQSEISDNDDDDDVTVLNEPVVKVITPTSPITPTLFNESNNNNNTNNGTVNNSCSRRHSELEEDCRSDESQDCPIEILMERLRNAQKEGDEELAEFDVEIMFRSIEKENEKIMRNSAHPQSINPLIERFINSSSFGYTNFNSSKCSVLRIQEYSWSDEACSLADRFYPDIGKTLEDKFNCSYGLTYNTMGNNTNIDTSLFRLSVWIYVHSLYGIRHDDFNYSQLDNLLTKPLKFYIKKVVTKPCTVKMTDFLRYLPEFRFSEKIHVALMLADARQQACLLHILKAMKSINN